MRTIEEVYLQPERYNPRIRATVSGAWIVVYTNGDSFPVCPDYAAKNTDEVYALLNSRESTA